MVGLHQGVVLPEAPGRDSRAVLRMDVSASIITNKRELLAEIAFPILLDPKSVENLNTHQSIEKSVGVCYYMYECGGIQPYSWMEYNRYIDRHAHTRPHPRWPYAASAAYLHARSRSSPSEYQRRAVVDRL